LFILTLVSLHYLTHVLILSQAFLTPAFVKENPDSADYVERLKSSLVEQVRIEG